MKLLTTLIICVALGFAPITGSINTNVTDNYKVITTKTTSTGKTYDIKCTDCGKYITVYYKKNTDRYARGDSPWYTQHKSLDDAAENGCDDRCD